jgi:PAS domain S-box-containing protein
MLSQRRSTDSSNPAQETHPGGQAPGDPRYHAFIQQTLDAIYVYDAPSKQILECNAAFLELLGYTPDEVQHLTVSDIVVSEQASITLYFQEIIVSGRGSRTERRWRRKDGTLIDVQVTASPIQQDGQELVFVVARDITERKQAEQRSIELLAALQAANTRLADAYESTLEGLAIALELRDKETEGHTRRVTETTVRLARAMGLSEENIVHIRRGALLHDIGKIGIPDSILRKTGPLTEDELAVMHKHPIYAYDMISAIPFLHPAIDIPYCHHERWDGTGYPRGLRDEAIPLAARLFAIVDVWDALSSDRPYRKGWPAGHVLKHIRALSGKHFDPAVVNAFLKLLEADLATQS